MGCCCGTPTASTKANSYQAPGNDRGVIENTQVQSHQHHQHQPGLPTSPNSTDFSRQPPPNQPPPQLPGELNAAGNVSHTPTPPTNSSVLFVALFDYDARVPEDLDFKKNDLLEVVNSEDPNWWLARHTRTQKEGFIPSNFVAISQSIDAQP